MAEDEISLRKKMLKGTTTIGFVCSDGVVIGADSRATYGTTIASTEARKVWKIDDNLGLTIAGGVGDALEIIRMLKAHNEIYKMNEGRPMSPRSAASLLSIILQNNKMFPFYVGLIVAGVDDDTPQLYSMDPFGGTTEDSRFTTTGSGSEAANGYLEEVYKKMPVKDATKYVARALAIAMKRDSATGDSMIVATITKSGYTEYAGKALEKMVAQSK
ncbi:MAG: proteasome subunit beta [Candidatus Micrarchaeota archaeon]|nr:proteasome subunit beta [Candidatus Micrarchaeota archaeon]